MGNNDNAQAAYDQITAAFDHAKGAIESFSTLVLAIKAGDNPIAAFRDYGGAGCGGYQGLKSTMESLGKTTEGLGSGMEPKTGKELQVRTAELIQELSDMEAELKKASETSATALFSCVKADMPNKLSPGQAIKIIDGAGKKATKLYMHAITKLYAKYVDFFLAHIPGFKPISIQIS